MYQVNLIRERSAGGELWSEDEVWVDCFNVEDGVSDAGKALRNAVSEFLSTEKGKGAVEETCEDFNWGDAIMYVPDSIWNKHGIYPIPNGKSVCVFVNQDEILCD